MGRFNDNDLYHLVSKAKASSQPLGGRKMIKREVFIWVPGAVKLHWHFGFHPRLVGTSVMLRMLVATQVIQVIIGKPKGLRPSLKSYHLIQSELGYMTLSLLRLWFWMARKYILNLIVWGVLYYGTPHTMGKEPSRPPWGRYWIMYIFSRSQII